MEVYLVGEALKFMALGMSIVFIFLVIMIFALKAQAVLIAKYLVEEEKLSSAPTKKSQAKTADNKNVVAAITAAILHHNKG